MAHFREFTPALFMVALDQNPKICAIVGIEASISAGRCSVISQTTEYGVTGRGVVGGQSRKTADGAANRRRYARCRPATWPRSSRASAGPVCCIRATRPGRRLYARPLALVADDVGGRDRRWNPLKRIRRVPPRLCGPLRHALPRCNQQLDDAIAAIEKSFSACKISKLIDATHPSSPLCAYLPKAKVSANGRRAKR